MTLSSPVAAMRKMAAKLQSNESGFASGILVAILLGLIIIVVGLSLVGTVASSTNSSFSALTGNASAQNLVNLVPLLFVLVIIAAVIGLVVYAMSYKE